MIGRRRNPDYSTQSMSKHDHRPGMVREKLPKLGLIDAGWEDFTPDEYRRSLFQRVADRSDLF